MRKIDGTAPRTRNAKLWRVLVAGGVALAAACAGMQKSGSSSSGSGGESGSQGTSGTSGADGGGMSGGNAGGAGGW